jgi:hypothetical protein
MDEGSPFNDEGIAHIDKNIITHDESIAHKDKRTKIENEGIAKLQC